MMYRTRPTTVEAVQITASNTGDVLAWTNSPLVMPSTDPSTGAPNGLLIQSAEGVQIANVGDWVVRSPGGELYVRNAHIFNASYEPAS